MRTSFALWLLCLSLVSARIIGLHLHACAGIESGTNHSVMHFADNGFLFGDYHAQDDGDDQEIDLVAAPISLSHFNLDDRVAIIPAQPVMVSTIKRLLTVLAPNGPPLTLASRPPYFSPPLRGPPAHFLA